MKLVIAYIRTECAAHVMRDLYGRGRDHLLHGAWN